MQGPDEASHVGSLSEIVYEFGTNCGEAADVSTLDTTLHAYDHPNRRSPKKFRILYVPYSIGWRLNG